MPVASAMELFICLSKMPEESRRPIACYDLSHLPIACHVTPYGWELVHNPGSTCFLLASFTERNWQNYQKVVHLPVGQLINNNASLESNDVFSPIQSIIEFILAADTFRDLRHRAHPADFRYLTFYLKYFICF